MDKLKKEIAAAEPYWQKLVSVFFDFCREKFNGEEPCFDRSAPRDMKEIIHVLKMRAAKQGFAWTEKEAMKRWRGFLEHAFKDDWLSRNFILMNLARFKDKVFLNLITPKNGRHQQASGGNSTRVTKSSGAEQLINILKDKLVTGSHTGGE